MEYRVRGVVVDPSKLKNRSYTYGKQNLSNGYLVTDQPHSFISEELAKTIRDEVRPIASRLSKGLYRLSSPQIAEGAWPCCAAVHAVKWLFAEKCCPKIGLVRHTC